MTRLVPLSLVKGAAKKGVSAPVGIFSAISHPELKFGEQSDLSDVESTQAGSDRDVIDITDSSGGEWSSVEEVSNVMDIEFEEYQPPPPQMPKGFHRQK